MQPSVWGALRVLSGFVTLCLGSIHRAILPVFKTAAALFFLSFISLAAQTNQAEAVVVCPDLAIAATGLATNSFRADAITKTCGRNLTRTRESVRIDSADNKVAFNVPLRVSFFPISNDVDVTPTVACTGAACDGNGGIDNSILIDKDLGGAQVFVTWNDSIGRQVTLSFVTRRDDDTLFNLEVRGGDYDLPPPSISSIVPPRGPISGGTVVTINGAHFSGTPTVNFNGVPATNIQKINDNQLIATTPAGPAGPVGVRVIAQDGAFTEPNAFTYELAAQNPLSLVIGNRQLVGNDVTSTLSTTGGSGTGAVTFSVASGAQFCSIVGTTLTESGSGTCEITATKAADSTFAEATVTQSIAAGRTVQHSYTLVSSPAALSVGGTATLSTQGALSAGADTFSLVSGGTSCSLVGQTLTGLASGSCVVRAQRDGDVNYLPATADRTIHVSTGATPQAGLTGTATPATIAVGNTTALSSTGGSGTGATTYLVSAGANVCSISGTTLTATAAGNCTVTVTKAGDATFLPATTTIGVTVTKGTQATLNLTATRLSIARNETVTLHTTGGTGTGAISFGLAPGTTACSINGNVVTGLNVGTCGVTATKAEDANYLAATASLNISVSNANQTITFAALPDVQFIPGGLSTGLSATASSGLAVTFTSVTTSVCTVAGNTVTVLTQGTCTINADQSGDVNFAAADTVTRSFEVLGLATRVTLSAPVAAANPGDTITLTATIVPATAQGTVSFFDGATPLCANVAHANGIATCDYVLPSGSRSLSATLNGAGNFATTTSVALQVVGGVPVIQTVKTTARFLSRRASLLFNSMFGGTRQVGRLREAGAHARSRRQHAGHIGNGEYVSRLADGPSTSDFARQRVGAAGRASFDSLAGLGLRGSSVDRDTTSRGGKLPFSVSGSTNGPTQFGFSASLSEMRRHNAATKASRVENALGMSYGNLDAAGASFNPFDIWVEGKYSRFSDGNATADIDGYFGSVTIGADYVMNPALLIGVFAEFDTIEHTNAAENSKIVGDGWLAGAYATMKLREDLFWQARGGWGHAENEINPDGSSRTGFNSERWMISSKLTGRWNYHEWMIQPEASVSYMEETAMGYTDANGLYVPRVRSKLGQAKAGPVISYRHETVSGTIFEPRVGLHAVWNFASGTNATGFGELEDGSDSGVRGRTELGLRAVTSGGVGLDLSGSYDGIGHDTYSAVTGRASVSVPLN